jgi:hypothetical protein
MEYRSVSPCNTFGKETERSHHIFKDYHYTERGQAMTGRWPEDWHRTGNDREVA